MIYLIGGAPRSGKSILGQQVAAKLNCSWISTDILYDMLRAKALDGMISKWDASPESIVQTAAWFYPCLERFVWGVASSAENYVIEGVTILPAQVAQLKKKFAISAIFVSRSSLTLDQFIQFRHQFRIAT